MVDFGVVRERVQGMGCWSSRWPGNGGAEELLPATGLDFVMLPAMLLPGEIPLIPLHVLPSKICYLFIIS
jgi:hypothetical protein